MSAISVNVMMPFPGEEIFRKLDKMEQLVQRIFDKWDSSGSRS